MGRSAQHVLLLASGFKNALKCNFDNIDFVWIIYPTGFGCNVINNGESAFAPEFVNIGFRTQVNIGRSVF